MRLSLYVLSAAGGESRILVVQYVWHLEKTPYSHLECVSHLCRRLRNCAIGLSLSWATVWWGSVHISDDTCFILNPEIALGDIIKVSGYCGES